MGADADHDQPVLVALDGAVEVGRRRIVGQRVVARELVDQIGQRHGVGGLDFFRRAVADEDRLAAPQHGDRLAFLDRRDIDLDGGERLRTGVRVHLLDERPQRHRSTDCNEGAGREDEKIPAVRFFGVNCHGCLR